MNNPFGVGSGQGVGDVDGDVEHFVEVHGLAPDALLQALPLQLLHHNEGMAVIVFDFEDGADGRVVEQRRGPSLTLEAFHGLAVAGEVVGKKLYGDVAAEPRVFRLVDHAHAAAPKFTQNTIVRDRLADHRHTGRYWAGRFAIHGEAQPRRR